MPACDDGADRKSTRLNSSHVKISYAVFCLKKKSLNLQPGLLRILTHMISAAPRRTLPVSMTVRIIEEYAAHRQMCPASADFTSSTDGLRFLSSRAFAVTSHPAVQKPQSAAIYR